MTPTDWSTDHGIPATVSAPDLFGGELFGDELMDMYNSDAVVGTSGDVGSDITHLLSSAHGEHNVTTCSDEDLPDSFDDGLGAFRPSTSFNDLTSLLPEDPPSSVESTDSIMTSCLTSNPPVAGEKRALSNANEPLQKKRTTTTKARASFPGQGRRTSVKPSKSSCTSTTPSSSAGQAALKLRKEQQVMMQGQGRKTLNNTPNPLGDHQSMSGSRKSAKAFPAEATSSPALVSPRDIPNGKGDSITSEAAAATAAAAAAIMPVPPPAPVSCPTTEADFKSVAQAAVTNLILNAGTTKDDIAGAPSADDEKIDTSTAHIKALTSSNWVAACSGGGPESTDCVNSVAGADTKANRVRRQNLTPDERARQNRDRNREHARNTRLRKKAYVEELKRTLTELVNQRDAGDLEKRHSSQRELEQREVRFRVMEEFLKLRGRNEASFARWAAILEDSFEFTLPVTEYRNMVENNVENTLGSANTQQTLHGASEAMEDSTHLETFLHTLGNGTRGHPQRAPVTLVYECDRQEFFMDGCTAVLMWTATTIGAIDQGAPMELTIKGNMRAKFSPASNKLINAEIMFDTGSVASHLQLFDALKNEANATGSNAVAAAQAAANEADALLDSLQMPQLGNTVPSAIVMPSTVIETSAVSVSDKDDSSDEGLGEASNLKSGHFDDPEFSMTARRNIRRKD